MTLLRNLLALIGLLALLVAGYMYYRGVELMRDIDPQTPQLMTRLAQQSREGPLISAMVLRMPVASGVSADQAVAAMRERAAARQLQLWGQWSLDGRIQTELGTKIRYAYVLAFWDPNTAAALLEHNTELAAFLPARVAVIEDAQGKLWLESPDLGLLVHGGPTPNAALQQQAARLQAMLTDIMQTGARGQP